MRAAFLLAVLGSCAYTGTFECFESEQCLTPGGVEGACLGGSCAFADDGCTAGYRFADTAADEVSGVCLERVPPADCATWTPRHFMPCSLPIPLGGIRISAMRTYDTDTGAFDVAVPHTSAVLPQSDGTMVRVLSVTTFAVDIGITLTVTGSLPLVVAAWDSIAIAGRIDASSKRGGTVGPGANPTACTGTTAGAIAIMRGSGGGGAGGFAGGGGGGGPGGYPMQAMGGMGGTATVMTMLTSRIRGGCPGAASGAAGPGAVAPATAASFAAPGAGGGALQLTARRALAVTGTLLAGGAGGSGAPFASSSGGGGGGSGGYLGLEAPMIVIAGSLAANGGAGGGGGSDLTGGGHGADSAVGATSARGGGGGAMTTPGGLGCEGIGGNGAAGTSTAGGTASVNAGLCGGGGGGGAAGVIAVRSAAYTTMPSASISPAVSMVTP